MKKQYNTIVLALSLLLLSINLLNAQETSSFNYEITQPVCSPYGSVSLTNSGAAIGQEFELEYYNALEETSLTRNSTLKDITAKEEITGLAPGTYKFRIRVGETCYQEFDVTINTPNGQKLIDSTKAYTFIKVVNGNCPGDIGQGVINVKFERNTHLLLNSKSTYAAYLYKGTTVLDGVVVSQLTLNGKWIIPSEYNQGGLESGRYFVKIVMSGGCDVYLFNDVNGNPIEIKDSPTALSWDTQVVPGCSTATITITNPSEPMVFTWEDSGVTGLTRTNVSEGTYTLVGTSVLYKNNFLTSHFQTPH